ncbi:hypothetical protein ACFQVC_32530 [Streptomyces monticola]|uniref:Uncharacterized protein n=1 Tax=Streptomyces monticola TaxID=2666263 RepID=A0ABW2JSH3_9ACTN
MTQTTAVPEGLVLISPLPGGEMKVIPLGTDLEVLAPLASIPGVDQAVWELLEHPVLAGNSFLLARLSSGESIEFAPGEEASSQGDPLSSAFGTGLDTAFRTALDSALRPIADAAAGSATVLQTTGNTPVQISTEST